jgi:hypothetical protein
MWIRNDTLVVPHFNARNDAREFAPQFHAPSKNIITFVHHDERQNFMKIFFFFRVGGNSIFFFLFGLFQSAKAPVLSTRKVSISSVFCFFLKILKSCLQIVTEGVACWKITNERNKKKFKKWKTERETERNDNSCQKLLLLKGVWLWVKWRVWWYPLKWYEISNKLYSILCSIPVCLYVFLFGW